MVGSRGERRRVPPSAFLGGVSTSRLKVTTIGRVDGGWSFAFQTNHRPPARWIKHRNRCEQCLCIRMCRRFKDGADGTALDDSPEVHDGDLMGDEAHDGEIVRDEQIGDPHLLLERLQEIQDLRLYRHVQGACRLVAYDESGLDCQRACNTDALALSAGEFVRI